MTVKELIATNKFTALTVPCDDREINGIYIGDLLSWVMGKAQADDAWITIMSNVNIAAVAALADTACIILAEGVTLEEQVITVAKDKGINVLCSDEPAYEIALALAKVL